MERPPRCCPVVGGSIPYTYTDIQSGFFAQARERFADYPQLDYRVLNMKPHRMIRALIYTAMTW